MKKIYQIVAKGLITNKIILLNFSDYLSYKAALKEIIDSKILNLITTNIYNE